MCSGLPCLHPDTLLLALVSLTQEADLLQANFKKYASGGGFVSQELAGRHRGSRSQEGLVCQRDCIDARRETG